MNVSAPRLCVEVLCAAAGAAAIIEETTIEPINIRMDREDGLVTALESPVWQPGINIYCRRPTETVPFQGITAFRNTMMC